MDFWDVLSYGAWIGSVLLFGWMLRDAWGVSRRYDERFLLSSTEGEE